MIKCTSSDTGEFLWLKKKNHSEGSRLVKLDELQNNRHKVSWVKGEGGHTGVNSGSKVREVTQVGRLAQVELCMSRNRSELV